MAFDADAASIDRSVLWIQRDITVSTSTKQRDGYKGPKYIRGVGFEDHEHQNNLGQKWTTDRKELGPVNR